MVGKTEDSRSESALKKSKDEEGEVESTWWDADGEEPSSVSGRKEMSIHALLGGRKRADILLWRNKCTTASMLAGVTVIWFLFERIGYQLLVLVCNSLMLSLASLFVWSNVSSLIRKSPPRYPVIHFEEDLFVRGGVNVASNKPEHHLLPKGGNGEKLEEFSYVGLWFLTVISSWCSFFTLLYIVLIMSHTVPALYEGYADHVDCFADKAVAEIKKQLNALDEKFLTKLPGVPLRNKKQR